MNTINGKPLSAQAGFTLVELMIVVVIAAILASIAVPSFQSFIQGQRVKSAAAELHASFTLARSEAVKRSVLITVNAKTGGWAMGWQTPDPVSTNPVLEDHPATSSITIAVSPSTTAVAYLPDGRTNADASTVFTFSGSDTTTRRCLTFSLRGPSAVSPC
ncbi:MAG: GspH/FimT family pseudopilin [Polaromonas sp.]|nr:GspH/FimT family pseudopilin [Polaromonas sp.]